MIKTQVDRQYIDIALSDFMLGYQEKKIYDLNDVYNFARYMHGFYPKIPYLEVANMLVAKLANGTSLNEKFDDNLFNNNEFGLKKVLSGHFMEIINYTISNNSDVPKKIILSKK